ncbi:MULTISPECIES: MBL fold metallo-hydrolase [Pseudothermotoga]|uniref:Beta-lactamase domain protein n=3 Tax=Pseudothermotoga TaxID=1643951 RepID=A8F3J0_PSELT|nr:MULTISPECIES: MBL fold metallo-hydrolase [Pseudothermotoga]ABV32724.1 beta-lactamase domain protein [Pseudothermotoga lettingae TMO]MDI3495514.1 N-acyl homoserine lactone hydrolase [Pseudothermotoga sp.]MDK2885269.1 N-acyl homoserine lactone hydrolase [Pseudothermotoga sp.]GLI48283.1 MBL fold metallo-hydrolase [Pseudothermotoga lettingae TMO]HBJ81111.1 MBL fold metallo-hydrolase [Pseudothermotoga sp.]
MRVDILVVGGTLRSAPYVMAPYSTVCLLYDENKKMLIDPGSFVTWQSLEQSLKARNILPEDITDIILTHVHMDHIFNSIFFRNAMVHVHQKYRARDYSSFGPITGQLYSMVVSGWNHVNMLSGGEKLFGFVEIFYSPFHSSDHVSLVIESENMGKIFMPGDICYTKVDYYEIAKGYRNDEAAHFVRQASKNCDWIVFTHDEPLKL